MYFLEIEISTSSHETLVLAYVTQDSEKYLIKSTNFDMWKNYKIVKMSHLINIGNSIFGAFGAKFTS